MKKKQTEDILARLSHNEELLKQLMNQYKNEDMNILVTTSNFTLFKVSVLLFIETIFGKESLYYEEIKSLFFYPKYKTLFHIRAILQSIRTTVENQWLTSFKGIVSAEIFTNFLEMAEYLLEQKYKDPAAVIIGSVLENHLKQLAQKYEIDITYEKDGKILPKKAEILNGEIFKKNVYNLLDQKNVTAWLDLRNNAAHGKYDNYDEAQVKNMFDGVSNFISKTNI